MVTIVAMVFIVMIFAVIVFLLFVPSLLWNSAFAKEFREEILEFRWRRRTVVVLLLFGAVVAVTWKILGF